VLAAVVLNYRTPELTAGAIDSLLRSERKPELVLVVDNGSGDASQKLLAEIPGTTFLGLEKNLGFSGGCNAGIQRALEAGAKRIVLVNSDARVQPETLGVLEEELARAHSVGIAGPLLVTDSAPDIVESAGIQYSPTLGVMQNLAAGKHRRTLDPGARTVDGVAGAVMMIRREVFERIGLFFEDYFFSFEDLDLCLRAREAGFLTVCTAKTSALHLGSATIGAESPRRLYFGARNHLLLASRARPMSRLPGLARGASIATLNVAHALFTSSAPKLEGLTAVARGIADHLRKRYGEGGGR
jgi:GT2 family glycosyltransferase